MTRNPIQNSKKRDKLSHRGAAVYQAAWNFLGLPDRFSDQHKARACILPVPYEGTTCYGAGTREGPAAIIAASRQVERYDYEFETAPAEKFGIHTLPPLAPVRRSPEAMVDTVETAVADAFRKRPSTDMLCVLGGEHIISAGVARGMLRAGFKDFVTVHIDAHADLWNEYEGSRYSHACAARRIVECSPIFQIGVRTLSREEEDFSRRSSRVETVLADEVHDNREYLDKLASFVRNRIVFLTIDLDGFDPSEMPAVGTPEPGGLTWKQVMDIVHVVCAGARRVPVFDVVELAPVSFLKGPDFLAAKLIYKVFSLGLLGTRKLRQKKSSRTR